MAAQVAQRAWALVGKTEPNGSAFAAQVSEILKRENNWILWKSAACAAVRTSAPRLAHICWTGRPHQCLRWAVLATKGSCPPYEKSVPPAEPDSAEEQPSDAAAPSAVAEQPALRKRKAEVGRSGRRWARRR